MKWGRFNMSYGDGFPDSPANNGEAGNPSP